MLLLITTHGRISNVSIHKRIAPHPDFGPDSQMSSIFHTCG